MVNKDLLEGVNRLGFQLLEAREEVDANKILADVVKSNDTRLWEGFPALLANAARDFDMNCDKIKNYLTEKEQADFHELLLMSLSVYQIFHLTFAWANQLKKTFSPHDLSRIKEMKTLLSRNREASVGGRRFDPDRVKQMFGKYFEQDAVKTIQLKEKHEELSLEYALSQIFSPKQKELFQKKLNGAVLSKTEKEYFSRTVRKKLVALANPELHRLSQKLMNY